MAKFAEENFQWAKRISQDSVDNLFYKRFGFDYLEYRKEWNESSPGNNLQVPRPFRHRDCRRM